MRHLLRSLLNRGSFAVSALIAVVVLAPVSLAQSTVPLRYKWKEGQVLRYRITNETVSESESSGPQAPSKFSRTDVTVTRMTVQSVAADGTATIAGVLESNKSEAGAASGNDHRGSADPAASKSQESMTAVREAMLNEQVILIVRSDGSIKQLKGLEHIKDVMRRTISELPLEMRSTFEEMLSEDALKEWMGTYTITFPSQEVKFGESWTQLSRMLLPTVGTISKDKTMTFKGLVERAGVRVAKVDFGETISHESAANDQSGVLPDDANVSLLDGSGSGEIWFDSERGQLLKQVNRSAMSMKITWGKDEKITQRTESVQTVELIDEPSAAPAASPQTK